MPKETFFNLPDAKRQMIEDAAIDEFATWGYDNASINRIVEACGIAKGSFYQYFDDKKDLYRHLFDRIAQDKLAYISLPGPDQATGDFFQQLTEMYRAGLAFARHRPKAARIANQLLKNMHHPVNQEIMRGSGQMASEFFQMLLSQAIQRGEVRSDIDVRFVSFMLVQMNVSIIEYHFESVKHSEYDIAQLDGDMMETVNAFMDFIKSGIGSHAEGKLNDDQG